MAQGIKGSRPICAIDGCQGRNRAHGWCNKHYQRWLKHGDPETVKRDVRPGPSDGRCTISECARPHYGRGLCNMHWRRKRIHGDPLAEVRIYGDNPRRFWSKVDVGHPLGCWEWLGRRKDGYGYFAVGEGSVIAHRWAYTVVIGAIPDGLTLDHLCRNRPCVNPDHLEPVTSRVNTQRGYNGANNRAKTHCPQGHPYDAANTYRPPGRTRRMCRTCMRARKKARRQ